MTRPDTHTATAHPMQSEIRPDILSAAAQFIEDMFAGVTTCAIYVCCLKNQDNPTGDGPQHRFTRDLDRIDAFVHNHDRPGYGIFFCVSTVRQNATTRSKETISELTGIHCDLDFKGIVEDETQIWNVVDQLPLPPSKAVPSGHGIHLYWLFREALHATVENIAKVEQLLKAVARHLAADRGPAHAVALMRLPGSHNSKFGEWTAVEEVAHNPDARYRFDVLFEWLKNCGAPALTRKATEKEEKANGGDNNVFLDFAAGVAPPSIDVESRLAAMRYQGPDGSGIHITQLQCSSSLLSRGVPLDEVVRKVLDATRTAAGAAGSCWNWSEEEQTIEAMCRTWIAKHPTIAKKTAPDPSPVAPQPSPIHDWPEPDLAVLHLHRRRARKLPIEIFGDRWARLIEDNAAAAACPVDYVVAPLLAAASTVIGHARWARAGKTWSEPPHLWCASVGESGDGKSPGADVINRNVVPEIERRMRVDFPDQLQEAQAAIEIARAKHETWKSEVRDAIKNKKTPPLPPPSVPEEPVLPRFAMDDVTHEKVALVLARAAADVWSFLESCCRRGRKRRPG
jgi:hypothetical protein